MGAAEYFQLALDRESVRTFSKDGHLHVKVAHITKANVCPYLGKEIPNSEALGLKPNQVYQLLRAPDELAKAAPTLNNIQLLIKHSPVNAQDPKMDLTVGSTGTDAAWHDPYLDNSLVVWDAEAIEGIESDQQKELSAGYHYLADMTPGTYEGVPYDGVMREIRFNHVALVVNGRAGDDIVVGDSALTLDKEIQMSKKQYFTRLAAMAKGALMVSLAPRLALDQKLDLNALLIGANLSNWKASKAKIADAVRKAPVAKFQDKLAQDAAVEDVIKLLDSLDGEELGDKPDDNLGRDGPDDNLDGVTDPKGTAVNDSPNDAVMALLAGKLSPEDMAKVTELLKPKAEDDADGDGDVEEVLAKVMEMLQRKKPGMDKEGKDAQPAMPAVSGEKDMVSKPAMDAAIKKAIDETRRTTVKHMEEMAEAKREVKPFIGEVTVAMDSADAIYKLALDEAGIDLEGVPPAAYRAMLRMLPKPGTEQLAGKPQVKVAMDSKTVVSLDERFPGRGKVRQLG